ncbi:MAG: ATP-binding protein [Rhodoferax sp.]|nr:ATP-binding protein [Rhodoferax sp.]
MNTILDNLMANLPADTTESVIDLDEPGECTVHGEQKIRALKFKSQATGQEFWTQWYCKTCVREQMDAGERDRLKQAQQEQIDRRMANSGLRGRFLECTFGNFEARTADQQQALVAVQQYFESPTGTLWLVGPVGTGKTHLAAAGVRHCCEVTGVQAIMISVRQLIRELRSSWEKGAAHTESQLIEYFGTLPVLVLDEVGVGFGSEAELTQLFDVLDFRYTERRATVLLSNLAPSGIKAALGERSYDRMREGAQLLRFEWKSYRAGGSKHDAR